MILLDVSRVVEIFQVIVISGDVINGGICLLELWRPGLLPIIFCEGENLTIT